MTQTTISKLNWVSKQAVIEYSGHYRAKLGALKSKNKASSGTDVRSLSQPLTQIYKEQIETNYSPFELTVMPYFLSHTWLVKHFLSK